MNMIARNAIVAGLVMGLAMFSSAVWADPQNDDDAILTDANYRAAEIKIKAGNFKAALVDLNNALVQYPSAAGIYSYIGFVMRKTGDKQQSMENYTKALSFDPAHRGALEYSGELYLELDNVAKAEENLAKLDKLCTFGCSEYTDLKKAIEAHKAKKKS